MIRSHNKKIVSRLKYLPIVNFLLNSAWIIVYTQQWFLVSVIVILALLYNIARMYVILSDYRGYNRLPFSIYFGWTKVATIVNIFSLTLNNYIQTIFGLDELSWTMIAFWHIIMSLDNTPALEWFKIFSISFCTASLFILQSPLYNTYPISVMCKHKVKHL